MSLDDYLTSLPLHCEHGYDLKTQHPSLCPCKGKAERNRILPAVAAAHPDESARLESAIRRLAASGRTFSANAPELRFIVSNMHGPVVGSVFGRLSKAGVITKVGYEPSTLPSTKGHDIKRWRGSAA